MCRIPLTANKPRLRLRLGCIPRTFIVIVIVAVLLLTCGLPFAFPFCLCLWLRLFLGLWLGGCLALRLALTFGSRPICFLVLLVLLLGIIKSHLREVENVAIFIASL